MVKTGKKLLSDNLRGIVNNTDTFDYALGFAIVSAYAAGAIIRKNFKPGMKKTLKSDGSPVTDTDLRINKLLVETIRTEFPSHNILSEEGSYLQNKSQYLWVCDPIDGTIAFSHGIPTCSFSIALTMSEVPVVGVVYDPFMDRLYSAVIGTGARLNKSRIHVSKDDSLKGSVIGMSYWNGAQADLSTTHRKLIESGASVLMLGSIVYQGALVASGELSASIHPARYSYDSAALSLIVSEAKGKVTGLSGKIQNYSGKINGSVMSNGIIHDKIIDIIRG